jgi:ABC-type transport system substrate-binding protein
MRNFKIMRSLWLTSLMTCNLIICSFIASGFANHALAGGNLTITYKDDVSTLDPAIGYDWQNWSMIKALFSRLMDYKAGTSDVVPSLASAVEVGQDGLSYRFTLRGGVKFHNGRLLTANDVKYSLERAITPKTQGPGAGFFSAIAGFDDFTQGKTPGLLGVEAPDDKTVLIKLSRPDATFLHVMALNFASIVPKEAVEQYGADFGKHPVGSGAFKFKEWQSGQKLVFEKNADYFEAGIPKLDQVTVEVGQEPVVAVLRLQKGEIDMVGDGIPPAKFVEMHNDASFKDLIVEGKQLHTGYLSLNTQIKPLDDVRVRRALNMAINKERIVKLINGRATAAFQPLPPLMPGYDKTYPGMAYDPQAAKALLAEAGIKDGFETELYAANTDPQPRIAQAIQQDLAAIGVKAQIKALAQANVIAAGGTEGQAPMIWSGGMAWIADFPDPSNFYGPILSCGSAVAGGWNWSWYCNKDLDRRAIAADTLADPAKASQRLEEWGKIFTAVQEDAPWVPIFHENRYVLHSARVKADAAIFVDPVWQVHYPQLDIIP